MKIDINIQDFITEEHTKKIQEKITKAIDSIKIEDIKGIFLEDLSEEVYAVVEQATCEIDSREIGKKLTSKILKTI